MAKTTSRSPSLPVIRRSKSNFLSNRSDSEPTMCMSLSPSFQRQPSIVLTRASMENDSTWNGSLDSRLPSHLSLGSYNMTPAPTSPLSLFFKDKTFPPNRSVTPLLFSDHHYHPKAASPQQSPCTYNTKQTKTTTQTSINKEGCLLDPQTKNKMQCKSMQTPISILVSKPTPPHSPMLEVHHLSVRKRLMECKTKSTIQTEV